MVRKNNNKAKKNKNKTVPSYHKSHISQALCLYLPADGSHTSVMRQIERGIGFIGYYLEGQQELHTGHSSSLATWSKAHRQLVEARGDKPSAARPSPINLYHTCMCAPLSLSHIEQRTQSARGSRRVGAREKISCCHGDDRQRRTRAVCWVGAEGCLVSAWKQSCGLCTCISLCMTSCRKHEDRKYRLSITKKNQKQKQTSKIKS